MKIVNNQTLVPVGLAVVVIGTAAAWVESVRSEIKSHSSQLEILTKNQEANLKLNWEINARLSKIEWSLEETKIRKGK